MLAEKLKSLNMEDAPKPTLNKAIRQYFKLAGEISDGASSWLCRREIPTEAEVLQVDQNDDTTETQTSMFALPQNKVLGKWKSKDEYLSAHYELIREDILGPFKQALEDFKRRTPKKENETFSAYEKVSNQSQLSKICRLIMLQVY